ncbi:hypothetical protein IAT38_004679 [Cryptococcus sp. DSM 104549]
MPSPPPPRLPPIKLKLTLNANLHPSPSNLPATPTPAHHKKGKGKALAGGDGGVGEWGVAGGSAGPSDGRQKVPKASSTSTPLAGKGKTNGHANGAGPAPGPSSLRISLPPAGGSHLPSVDHHTPSTSNPTTAAPSALPTTASPAQLIATPTPAKRGPGRPPKSAKGSAKKTPKQSASKLKKKPAAARPSAIPARLLSTTPATAVSTPSRTSSSGVGPETPASSEVKLESEETSPDPLSGPLSPASQQADYGTPRQEGEVDTPSGSGKKPVKWMRIKKPLKELLLRIMAEIRKKDDYALFEDPVDLEAFPDYLDIIGGEDNMMDMGTMQNKVESGEYQNVDQIEADLRTLVTAAQKFNPPGSIPYNSAARILTVGLKHIDRSRPLVLTPDPSPRNSATPFHQGPQTRGGSVLSARELTAALEDPRKARDDVHPASYIPEEMLSFPPNSLAAKAVGWNLNGGKRVYPKRISRAREKFAGKWKNWTADGSRDIAEMDEITHVMEPWRMRKGDEVRRIVDWKALGNTPNWWELELPPPPPNSAAQVPAIPLSVFDPRRDKVPERELTPYDIGVFPEIEAELAFIRQRTGLLDDAELLGEHLRPTAPRPQRGVVPPPPNLVNIYDAPLKRTAGDWVREICTGDVVGEAYLDSVERFVRGAMVSGAASEASVPRETKREPTPGSSTEPAEDDRLPLNEYVATTFHSPLLTTGPRALVARTLSDLSLPASSRPPTLLPIARAAYARVALRHLTSPANPMDIKPLLREEADFMFHGYGGKNGVTQGLEWTGKELGRLVGVQQRARERKLALEAGEEAGSSKRKRADVEDGAEDAALKRIKVEQGDGVTSTASSPLSSAPPSPAEKPPLPTRSAAKAVGTTVAKPELPAEKAAGAEKAQAEEAVTDEELRRLRLELVALSKFYPLPALKKMTKEEAARLLPVNVRGLMCKP